MASRPPFEEFRDFQHLEFLTEEVAYKHIVIKDAQAILKLENWARWRNSRGRILRALQEACDPRASANLLEHRYGKKGGSAKSLHRVRDSSELLALEDAFYQFFLGGDPSPASFGPRFDALAAFLKEHRLGCNWAFLSYLAFLLDFRAYPPLRPNRFDALFRFYGLPLRLASQVEWRRYEQVLEVAARLRELLLGYGQATMVELQSYMWVVSGLVGDGMPTPLRPLPEEPDFARALARRQQFAYSREQRGLEGERLVFERLRARLRAAGRADLADAVRLVSEGPESRGFDILGFDLGGQETHVEVKTTSETRFSDRGFYLTLRERELALCDGAWTLVRVWSVDDRPEIADLGNVVTAGALDALTPASWFAAPGAWASSAVDWPEPANKAEK